MEALNRLPAELLFSINAHAADWVGLESLLRVLPQIGDLFSGDAYAEAGPEAIRLIESLLKENPIMNQELHRQFRMVLDLRRPDLADTSLAEFMARDYSLSLMASSSSISPLMLREMLLVTANIQRLVCACLRTLLTYLGRVQPRCWNRIRGPGLLQVQEGTEPYQPREAGPPSWIEEYRVYRALWHLQLFSDLSIAADRLNWAQSDIETFRTESMDRVWLILREELRTVSECLETLCEVAPTKSQALSTDDDKGIFLISQLPNVSQLRCKFDVWGPPSPPDIPDYDDGISMDAWGQGIISIDQNRMAGWFRACQDRSKIRSVRFQVCNIQDSRPWRGLGMPIWDLWRCYCLGLYHATYPRGARRGPALTPDGLEAVESYSPLAWGSEIEYRISVFMHARMQMEDQERGEGRRKVE